MSLHPNILPPFFLLTVPVPTLPEHQPWLPQLGVKAGVEGAEPTRVHGGGASGVAPLLCDLSGLDFHL